MPKMSLDVSHGLGQAEAAHRLKAKFAAVRAQYQSQVKELREEWLDHTLTFAFQAMGMAISGTVAVEPEKVRLAANLPFAAMLFKGTIEQRIRQEVGSLLAAGQVAPAPADG
jgi:hypothetical protein